MMIESFLYASVYVQVGLIVFALSFLGYLSMALTKSKAISTISFGLFVLGFLILTVFLVTRWMEAGRPPFKTVYESLIFGGWMISLISIFLEYRYKLRIMSLLTTLSVVGILIYALSKRDLEIVAMPPALQTWIFIPHVISYFLAYGALFVSGVAAILYLAFPKGIKGHHLVGDNQHIDLSEFTYIIAKFGFLFLTLGLFLGGWWGQVAWSSYWGWDPKENWALISWLIFAAYLHLNKMHHFSKRTLAVTVIIGVVAIIFTYLGMEYLPTAEQSIHIYLQ